MSYESNNHPERERENDGLYSKRLKAGKRRTYFFDVRATRGNDYFLTITESKKRFNDDGYDRHKIFLYKEDFNKFIGALTDAVDHVKTELLPDFDFDSFSHEDYEGHPESKSETIVEPLDETPSNNDANDALPEEEPSFTQPSAEASSAPSANEQVDKW